jgi:dTDP-glucose pyrophosphorylase
MRVVSPKEITYINIKKHLNKTNMNLSPKWKDEKLNVLIPMAGAGSRFEQAGYTFPKPLIEVKGKPMIQVVVENLNLDANYIYVVQKAHREKYNLDTLLNLITPGCKIVETEGFTEGAACTALLAKEFIDNRCSTLLCQL